MHKKAVEFKKLPIRATFGAPIKDVYVVIENGRSEVMENFRALVPDEQDLVKDLIVKMATVEGFLSPKIKYHLRSYNYGEIRPLPHRFFFFQKYGENIVFFAYALKKKRSLGNDFYKRLDKERKRYEKEFERFIQGHR